MHLFPLENIIMRFIGPFKMILTDQGQKYSEK
jgi:hypothetical protein